MVTGAIKNKVDKIWTDIWAGGITNPLTVIEQLTYLMFIRSLDEKELATEEFESMAGEKMEHIFPASAAGQSMRWSKFKDKDSREIFLTMQQRVFPAIKKMKYGRLPDFDENGELVEIEDDPTRPDEGNTAFARYMDDAMFLIPTPQVLQKIITGLEDLYTHDIADLDMQGDLYEYMLGKLATAGQNGQFRTPKHIRDMMVELVQPTPDDFICDPACGTAGFLVSSAQYLRAHYEDSMTPEQWQHFAGPMFTGFDTDRTMLRISAMNLMLHSITNPEIDYKDSVSKQNNICSRYTICLANPPFKGTVDAESINDDLKAVTNTKKTELLFLALFLRMLKTGGRCACIVPDGVLFGSSKAHQSIRKELIESHQLRAVISMPSGVFKPYAGVSTAVLIFTKIAGDANAFLCMLMIGVNINLQMDSKSFRCLIKHITVRYALSAVLAFLFYRYLPFSLEIRQAMAVIALAPSSSLALIFTMKLKGDVIMAGNICSLSILLSTIAMTILLVYL